MVLYFYRENYVNREHKIDYIDAPNYRVSKMHPIVPNDKRIYRKQLYEYKKQMRNHIVTSRFNTSTWHENERYRTSKANVGCIYCSPDPIASVIPMESIMFVLEMNNDTNKIMGVGMVRNRAIVSKISVYSNGNYNRYVYIGKTRINRTEMSEDEERIMKVFDILCFSGNTHMKRGQGLKSFPTEMLFKMSARLDMVSYIGEMFKKRIRPARTETLNN